MKKNVFKVIMIIAGFILMVIFYLSIAGFWEKRNGEMQQIIYETIPEEYLMLLDSEKLDQLKILSTTSNYADFPVSILEYAGQYEIVIFKKNIDTFAADLTDFLRIEHPLKKKSLNTRRYISAEGFVNFRFSNKSNQKPLENVLITMPKEGKIIKEIVNDSVFIYMIENCKEFNLFYGEEKNPDIIFELSTQLIGRKPVGIGLAIKQINNSVFFLFILPKNGDSLLISNDLIKKLIF